MAAADLSSNGPAGPAPGPGLLGENFPHGSGAATGPAGPAYVNVAGPEMAQMRAAMETMHNEINRLRNMVSTNIPADGDGPARGHDRGHDSKQLDGRCFKRVSTFEGKSGTYRDWKFDFLVCVGQANPRLSMDLKIVLGEKDKAESDGEKFVPEKVGPLGLYN